MKVSIELLQRLDDNNLVVDDLEFYKLEDIRKFLEKEIPHERNEQLMVAYQHPIYKKRMKMYNQLVKLSKMIGESEPERPETPIKNSTLEMYERILVVIKNRIAELSVKQTFTKKTKKQRQENGRAGGLAKFEANYQKFLAWAESNNFSIGDYTSRGKLHASLESKGYKISESTAGKYLKKYLNR